MSSELQRQVSSIRKQHLSTASLAQGRPSLFLTASEAAGVDVSTILEAASSGLATLQQYDSRFEVYQNTLLHPSSVDLQRELKTVSENKALDTDITNLLKLLSLYALESSTHLVLEYLIRRYRVHEMNTHVLLQSMLVAHDSKIFARIVQLCKLEDSPWAFLQGVKTSGVPLPRSALVQRALKDASLLEILSQYVQSALDSAVQRGNTQYPMSAQSMQGANKILSFYTAVVIEMAEERPFDDTSIRHVYLFLVEGLKNKYASHRSQNAEFDLNILDQWRRACCMILVQLSLRTPFGKPLIKVISAALAEAFKRGAAADSDASASLLEIVSTMCILSVQHKFRVTPKFLHNIIAPATFDRFLNVLLTVRDSYNAVPLATNLATALASDLGLQYEGKPSEESLSAADVARALSQLLASGLADAPAVRSVLFTVIAAVKKGAKGAAAASAGVKEVVQCIAQRFAAEFETTLQGLVAAASDDASSGSDALSAFLADVFSAAGQKHHMRASTQGAGLLLSLTSAIPLIRAQTLADFSASVPLEAASTADVLGLVHAVVQNLLDPIAEVAASAWTLPVVQRVARHLQGAELLDLFQTALSFWANNCDRSPEVAGKLVAAIFAALEDGSVLQSLLAVASVDQQKSLSGCQWVFLAAAPAALGSFVLRMQQDTLRTAHWEALAASATRVLKASSVINTAFSACSNVGNSAKNTSVLAALSASKFSQADGSFELVTAVAAHMYVNTSDAATGLYARVKAMKLLASICADLSKAGKAAKKDLSAYLEILCPLLLSALDRADALNAAAQVELLGVFDSFVALSAAPIPATNALSFAHIGARVVVKVLSAESMLVVKKLGACLQVYCPENAWKVLLQIALTTGQDRSSSLPASSNYLLGSKAEQSTFVGLSVRVEGSARTAALRALSAGISVMLDTKKTSFDASESTLLVSLVPVVLHLCGHLDAEQRSLGLLLASRLSALNANSKFVLASKSLSSDAAVKGIHTVAALITGRASIIAVEPFACAAALAADVFESKDAAKLQVASFLCAAALEFGWSSSAQTNAVFSAATQARLDTTWPFLKQLIQSAPNETDGHSELVTTLSKCIRLGYKHASTETQKAVVQWVTEGVSSSSDLVKQLILSLIEGSLFADASAEVRSQLFEALMNEQIERPGQKVVISALQVIQVELSLPARLLREQVEKFQAQYQVLSSTSVAAANSTAMVVDDDEDGNDGLMSGLSAPLQRVLSLLESLNGVLVAASAETDGPLMGSMSANLLDLLALLNESRLRSVMLVDYCKALLVETVHTALSVAGSRAVVAADNKKPTSGARKGAATKTSADSSSYSLSRVEGDIRLLLSCITSTKATQVQTAALKLLKVLLHLNPATVMPSMQVLGELLATSSANMQAGKEGLIEQILKTFVAFLPTGDAPAVAASNNECVLMPQYMLQSLCEHFYTMPHHRRSALLKMALSAMKAPSTLAVAVDVLLVHSFAAHETDTLSAGAAAEDLVSDEAKSEALILLSKSAHRRAHREMKSSVPEELFNLANELMLARAPNVQVSVIISLLSSAHRMLEIAITDGATTSTTARDALDILDIESTFKYCTTLFATNAKSLPHAPAAGSSGSAADDRRGHAATLAVLHLELIIELLENKAFHQMLVSMLDAQAASGLQSAVQEYFMSFADSVLQLLAMSSAAEQGLGLDERQKQPLRLRIGGTVLRLAPRALGKHVSSWCYEALHTLQKLMDGPSFVAIIQELIDHEKLDVRQKALVILGDRLESMTATKLKSEAEIDLYLDLNAHLRKVVQSFLPLLRQSGTGEPSADFYQQSGLAQSALMCIDVLARFLGTRLDWTTVLNDTLLEVVEFGAVLSQLTGPETNGAVDSAANVKGKKSKKSTGTAISSAVQAEHLKLLGSSSLCVATLSSVLGAQALSSLPTIMGQNLSALEHVGSLVVAGPGENPDEDVQALWRTRVLLVRSEISAVSIIVAQLSNFSHPYIPRILSASLVLEGMDSAASESALVRADVDRCLSTIATKIPTRLSVPLFLQSAPTLLAAGHSAACRFADLMAEVWQQLDRTTVVAHMGPLSTLATLLLDYRRVFGDQTAEANEVDAAAADAVVEMCLKLTESELKSFLTRLAEWRDVRFKAKAPAAGAVESADGDWRKYSRAVSYFSLTDVLMSKLKSLFNPMMAVLWSSAVDILTNFASPATAAAKSSDKKTAVVDAEEDGKKSKKRKQAETEASTGSTEQSRVVVELELVAKYVLSGVRECCAQDNGGFIEEARFDKMMPAVVALVPLLRAFASESAYLTYMEDYVGACLAALTVAVGRDLLWKPLNHKILLLTRDPRKAVRIASVKILHRLFSEVGDEYLLLLPECLPFLSELMEDSSREVVAATSEAISFIEELSGEKLDEFLQ